MNLKFKRTAFIWNKSVLTSINVLLSLNQFNVSLLKKDVLIPNLMVVYIFNDLFKFDGDLLLVMLFINSKNILCVSGK